MAGKRRAMLLCAVRKAIARKPKPPKIMLDESSIKRFSVGGSESVEGRIIAGERIGYSEEHYPHQMVGNWGFFGSHGTLDFKIWSGSVATREKERIVRKAESCNSPAGMFERLQRLSGPVMEIMREVPPKHQAKGIGTELLKAAEKMAKEQGVHLIYAVTENPHAVKSYERCGWQPIWQEHYKPKLMCYGKFLKG